MKKIFTTLSILLIASSVCWSQSGWWPIYSDSGRGFQFVQFINSNTGYGVGAKYTSVLKPSILKTTNAGSSWLGLDSPYKDSVDFYYRGVHFTDENTGFITLANYNNFYAGGILKTTDAGNHWFTVTVPVQRHMTHILFVNSSTGFATGYHSILKTTNAGTSWELVFESSSVGFLFGIYFTDVNTGYVVGNVGTILKTTNGGSNWISKSCFYTSSLWTVWFTNANTGFIAGGPSNYSVPDVILRTTNGGDVWDSIPHPPSINCLHWSVRFINSSIGFITGQGQVLKTINGGLNWYNQAVNIPNSENYFYTGTFFTNENTGYLFTNALLPVGHVFKTTNGGEPVGIKPVNNEFPAKFLLYQNYPNPFNPNTTIKFEIPLSRGVPEGRGVLVNLTIYDLLGRELATLVNENLKPGYYELEWNASNYPSGVYFYKLITNDFTDVKKMVLLK